MNLELGRIYKERHIRDIASYVVILNKEKVGDDHTICELIRVYKPDDKYLEYLNILENTLVKVKHFV